MERASRWLRWTFCLTGLTLFSPTNPIYSWFSPLWSFENSQWEL